MNGTDLNVTKFPSDDEKVRDVGMSYQDLIELIPELDLPDSYLSIYTVRGGKKVETLSVYAIKDFSNMLAISTEVEVISETDEDIRVKAIATNRRYDITHEGVRQQLKVYPDKLDEKTGEMKQGSPILNYFEISYVTAQRNAISGLLPIKRIVHIIKLSKSEKNKPDKFTEAANRIKEASKYLRLTITENNENLQKLGVDDQIIFSKGKELFGEDVNDWGAGQYKQLSEMIKNPVESGLAEVKENELEDQTVSEDELPPPIEEDPDVQVLLEESENVEES